MLPVSPSIFAFTLNTSQHQKNISSYTYSNKQQQDRVCRILEQFSGMEKQLSNSLGPPCFPSCVDVNPLLTYSNPWTQWHYEGHIQDDSSQHRKGRARALFGIGDQVTMVTCNKANRSRRLVFLVYAAKLSHQIVPSVILFRRS